MCQLTNERIIEAVIRSNGNRAAAARILGCSAHTVRQRLKQIGSDKVPPAWRGGKQQDFASMLTGDMIANQPALATEPLADGICRSLQSGLSPSEIATRFMGLLVHFSERYLLAARESWASGETTQWTPERLKARQEQLEQFYAVAGSMHRDIDKCNQNG